MPSTPGSYQQAQAIDRERTRLENAAVRASSVFLTLSAAEMTNAILGLGDFPPATVAARLSANLQPALADNLVTSSLQGRLRTLTTARAQSRPITIAGGGRGRGGGGRITRAASGSAGGGRVPRSINELAQEFVNTRLNLTEPEAQALVSGYGNVARSVSGEVGNQALKVAERLSAEFVHTPLPTAEAAKIIRSRLSAAGLTTQNPYAVETVYRTTVQMAYSAGRWQANQDPAVLDILWGYEYSAVMDDRTTDLCAELDGMRRPVDDPIWAQYLPPNHFGCRSTVIEVFNTDALAKPTDIPHVIIPGDFRVNWGTLLRAA